MPDSLWSHGLWPIRFLCLQNFLGKNIGVDSHSLLQGNLPDTGIEPSLQHCRHILYCLNYQGRPMAAVGQSKHKIQSLTSPDLKWIFTFPVYTKCLPNQFEVTNAAAAKLRQLCPTPCDPVNSLPGSSVPGILQARTLEWLAISFSNAWKVKSESEVAQSCPTLRDPMDCSLPGSSIHGIFQARVLEWVAIAF